MSYQFRKIKHTHNLKIMYFLENHSGDDGLQRFG